MARKKREDPRLAASVEPLPAKVPAGADMPLALPSNRSVAATIALMVGFLVAMCLVWWLKDAGYGGRMLAQWDIESLSLFTCAGLFAGFAVLHPAYGLAVLTILRPWLDGMTYPGDNLYFLAGILVLTVMWALRTLLRGGGVRHLLPSGLLLAYILLALVMLPATYQVDRTVEQVLLWSGYFALFFMVSNGMRARKTALLVLGGFLVSAFYEAIYAIIHFQFTLDYVRLLMTQDPETLKPLLGVDEITPEVIRRLNINRAFGTMLQPNSLAALMLLGAPTALGGLVYCARRSTEAGDAWRTAGRPAMSALPATLSAAASVFMTSMLATGIYAVLSSSREDSSFDFNAVILTALVASAVVSGAFAFLVSGHAKKHGATAAAYAAGAFGCLAATPVLLWALWLSYSRGAMLALTVASVLVGLLLLARRKRGGGMARAALALLFCAGVGLGAAGVDGDDVNRAASAANSGPVASGAVPAQTGPNQQLEVEGVDVTAAAMLDPSSLWIRVTYWRVGLRMALDNLWTGVGLGNFATAYPKYQDMRAGNVQTAHNALVKAFAETGLPGLGLFCLFWLVVLSFGVRLIWREDDPANRALTAGLLLAAVAFLGHALLDFHFAHPSLMFFLFLLVGLLYTRAHDGKAGEPAPGVGRQIPLLVLLVACALVAGVGYRVYAQHYALAGSRINISGEDRLAYNRGIAEQVLARTGNYGQARRKALREGTPLDAPRPRIPLRVLQPFIAPAFQMAGQMGSERELLDELGTFAAETTSGSWQVIGAGEPLPPEVWYFIDQKPFRFNELMVKACEAWAAEVAEIDHLFPYRPDLAAYLAELYETMRSYVTREKYPDDYDAYLSEQVRWTEEAVRRSPERYEFHTLYAKLLWWRGEEAKPEDRRPFFEKAVEEFRLAQQKAGEIVPTVNFNLSGVLLRYGNALIAVGETERGQRLVEESARYQAQGERIYRVRGGLGIL